MTTSAIHEERLPLILFEDEHLLVVNKPAGLNTHAPSPYAGEGLYDWLRHREPRWSRLAIVHRLDKETSGVMVFTKSPLANRSLTDQFTRRQVNKKYLLLSQLRPREDRLTITSHLVRRGSQYHSGAGRDKAEAATTHFTFLSSTPDGLHLIEAEPKTGRTHQIRVHAGEHGFPILGDTLYGGAEASRVYLHSHQLEFQHPASQTNRVFSAASTFSLEARVLLRALLVDSHLTTAYRLLHGSADGTALRGFYADRLGDYSLLTGEAASSERPFQVNPGWLGFNFRGAYYKRLQRHVRGAALSAVCPELIQGRSAPDRFSVRENGLRFELSFQEGYSTGLFLDQRDNRRRILANHITGDFPVFQNDSTGKEVLNAFAYTCGFSVCAALTGARTTSLDLSKKYLEWGKRNFALNQLQPEQHDFIYGDALNWLQRFKKRQRKFDLILLDPPTFSKSKESGVFQAEKDYSKLVEAALPLLRPNAVLFASTNAASFKPDAFVQMIEAEVHRCGRKLLQSHYAPQPPDFPVTRSEPAYLKTIWLRIA